MRRHLIAGALVLGMLIPITADLDACGDKFARVGSSSRLKAYKPMFPASILVFTPAGATSKAMAQLGQLLRDGRHTVTIIPHRSDVSTFLATGKYDLVLVHNDDASIVRGVAATLPGAPSIVPILPERSKKLESDVRRTFPYVITPYSMSKWDALEKMDQAMIARVKPALAPGLER